MPSSAGTIPFVFCIDAEPDLRLTDRKDPAPWHGLEEMFHFARALRPRLEKATGGPVHFFWGLRMDPQIRDTYGSPLWPYERYEAVWREFAAAGDHIGLHTHAYRWDSREDAWIIDHGSQDWIDECLDLSFNAFQTAFGRNVETFRFGDVFFNERTAQRIESLGASIDMTVEPGREAAEAVVTDGSERYTGRLADCTRAPRRPYRRSATDWQKADPARADGLWMLPLTTEVPETPLGRVKRKVLSAVGRARARAPVALRFSRHAETACHLISWALKRPNPYVAGLVHSMTPLYPEKYRNMKQIFTHIVQHPRAHAFRFCTPNEALRTLGCEVERTRELTK